MSDDRLFELLSLDATHGLSDAEERELEGLLAQNPDVSRDDTGSPEMRSLREHIARQYSAPFDVIFDGPQAAAELEPVDRALALALLIGPLAFGRLSTLSEFDYEATAIAAVDGFLTTFAKRTG